jgi:protein TIF31
MEALILQPLVKSPSSLNPWSDEEETVEIPSCLSLLTLSEFNPPNAKRRLAGDLLYLVVRTLEGNVVHVTCAVNGFWVNSSESGKSFKPDPSSESFASKTLPDLLCKLSAGFAAAFSKLLNIGAEWNSIRNLPSVLPCPAWQVNSVDEDSGSFFDPDGFVLRDWNEEFQMVRSLPSETPIQRIQRDKAMGKIYSDFLEAAVSGAKNVVHGCVQSLNPMDTGTQQLFVYNHIFFSFTEDLEYIVMCKQSNNKVQKLPLPTFRRI